MTPPGDGLGPDDVWSAPDTTVWGSTARIISDLGGSGFLYNFHVMARMGMPGLCQDPQGNDIDYIPSYAAKLVKGARGCDGDGMFRAGEGDGS